MSLLEILWWGTAAVFPLGIGAAIGLLGLSPPEFIAARVGFSIAAVALAGTSTFWILATDRPAWVRLAVGILAGAVLLAGLPEALRWVTSREKQTQIAAAAADIGPLVEALKTYEKKLSDDAKGHSVLEKIVKQYDALEASLSFFESRWLRPDYETHTEISAHLMADLKLLLQDVRLITEERQGTLFIKIGPNTFRVIFRVPMRIPPKLEFFNLPTQIKQANVIENSKVGFTVVFLPLDTVVTTFDCTADAEF
jgi:hypothetical protein